MPLDTSCLYSTVKCKVVNGRTFGFLPPHGRKLAYHEEFTVFGDIKQAIIQFDRKEARRSIIAFENALDRGDLDIIHTPNVILKDTNPDHGSKMLNMTNGALGVADPCWTTSVSERPPLG